MPIPSDSPDVKNFYYSNKHLKHPQVEIGDYTYGLFTVDWIMPGVTLKIGKFCSFGADVYIMLSGEHKTDWVSTYCFPALKTDYPNAASLEKEGPFSKGNVVIGNDVWIGQKATILSGVTIGDGAVIGANSTVARDIPPYAIAVGNPARVVRKRFSDEVIEQLLRIQWWDWPIDRIKQYAGMLSSNNIDAFLTAAKVEPL